MDDFKLSVTLEGHEDDVRGVVFPDAEAIYSASRDATVRKWQRKPDSKTDFEGSVISHGNAFVNTVVYVPPSQDFPEGLVVAGGKDTIIEVRRPNRPLDEHAERLLMGHAHNVCALDVSPKGDWIVSGSWDSTARLWSVSKWECTEILDHHQGSVWAVLAFDDETIVTGCADKLVRVFTSSGKLLDTIRGSKDVVRALSKLPKGHASEADFVSAGNDAVIRFWTLRGKQLAELHGHESFIYSLNTLPNGDLVSSGEDRTVRIWRGFDCIQTITHPAISVWTTAVSQKSGDIVTGASDRRIRVFTREPERRADIETLQAFERSVQESSIPQQQVGDVNKEELPGPEFLTQKSGTKEGQVVMIRETDGSVTAHSWSTAASQWVKVGTVVDSAASSGKKTDYMGRDYDYVFDVDIEDGKPPLKLPYNLSQNPYEAATAFIQKNELPIGYLDQVANFITTNTKGASIGQTSANQQQPAGADPWGQESRYRPGEQAPQPQSQPEPSSKPKILPQKNYLSITTANLNQIQKKIEELNEQLIQSGEKDGAMNPQQLTTLRKLITTLSSGPSKENSSKIIMNNGAELVLQLLVAWPPANQLPLLDILRLLAAATPAAASYKSSSGLSILEILEQSGAFSDPDRPNSIMLGVRVLANLFETEEGRQLADDQFDYFHKLIQPSLAVHNHRNLTISLTTLYINYAVLLTAPSHKDLPSSTDRGLALLEDLSGITKREKDSEIVYRSLVALGTLLYLQEEVIEASKDVFDVRGTLKRALGGFKEPRIKSVATEIEETLD